MSNTEYKNKGIILGVDGTAADVTIIDNVQEYVDPDKSGKGNGEACIGLPFIAEAPTVLTVNLSIELDSLADGYTADETHDLVVDATETYLKNFNFSIDDNSVLLSSAKLAAKIIELDCITDYNSVLLTSDTESGKITVSPYQYVVLGVVTIDVAN